MKKKKQEFEKHLVEFLLLAKENNRILGKKLSYNYVHSMNNVANNIAAARMLFEATHKAIKL